ncbi:MAG: hypothetical protein Q4P14_06135 [Methanobacteriaceae archaeon]|nr:hypothetical protein [Methanobacteriaceae archaeon]
MKIFNALKIYLTDWKNLLAHTLVGVVLLAIALFAPVHWIYRVIFLILVVVFNVIRMRYSKNKKDKQAKENENKE